MAGMPSFPPGSKEPASRKAPPKECFYLRLPAELKAMVAAELYGAQYTGTTKERFIISQTYCSLGMAAHILPDIITLASPANSTSMNQVPIPENPWIQAIAKVDPDVGIVIAEYYKFHAFRLSRLSWSGPGGLKRLRASPLFESLRYIALDFAACSDFPVWVDHRFLQDTFDTLADHPSPRLVIILGWEARYYFIHYIVRYVDIERYCGEQWFEVLLWVAVLFSARRFIVPQNHPARQPTCLWPWGTTPLPGMLKWEFPGIIEWVFIFKVVQQRLLQPGRSDCDDNHLFSSLVQELWDMTMETHSPYRAVFESPFVDEANRDAVIQMVKEL